MSIILITGKHLSPYKIIFLFIIIPVAIEFDINYSIACASISSIYLLIIDLIYAKNDTINQHFENDIIISAIFITISWLLSYYVKLEKEHVKMLENRANIDRLTGLYNHRYFYDKLIETVNLYNTNSNIQSVSLIFMDIDYFKEYNDMYGHLSGDTVLKKMGEFLNKITNTDIATFARYGGDEFAAIIINQTEKEVYDIGENIRNTFEKMEFVGQENISTGNITVSIGIAMYTNEIENYLEFIKCADDALYRAKFIKKNRVEIYSSVFDMIKLDIQKEHIDLLTSIKTLISVINAKDKYTYGHVERVVIYCKMIAERLDLSEEDKNNLIYSAYMHDVGKINIPEDILNKKMPLTKKEWKQMKMHPQNGVEIIKKVKSLSGIAPLYSTIMRDMMALGTLII
jgi:diguanylate cyclase (GGDEF)-like protein